MSELFLAQGGYYFVTGIWPILHMRFFLAVTGPKADLWLVRTVGLLVLSIGGALLSAWVNPLTAEEITSSPFILSISSATALLFIDIFYVYHKVIPPVYLLDAVIEAAILSLWIMASLL